MSERSTCAHCGEPIVLGPWFLDGRLPNPSIWTHVGSGRTCASKAKDWKRPDWPSAAPSMREVTPKPRGEISLESALLAAQAHEASLRDLYSRLRTSGHAYASNSAHAAAEAALALIDDLRGAGPVRPDEERVVPHDVDECEWEEGCRCLCPECQGRPDEEPTP